MRFNRKYTRWRSSYLFYALSRFSYCIHVVSWAFNLIGPSSRHLPIPIHQLPNSTSTSHPHLFPTPFHFASYICTPYCATIVTVSLDFVFVACMFPTASAFLRDSRPVSLFITSVVLLSVVFLFFVLFIPVLLLLPLLLFIPGF